jgi:hypothetical protein
LDYGLIGMLKSRSNLAFLSIQEPLAAFQLAENREFTIFEAVFQMQIKLQTNEILREQLMYL